MPEIDAEYAAFIAGPRTRAKQLAMLEIDVEFAVQWVETVTALVAQELPDREFVAEHITALKKWQAARKLRQKSLHYRFNPTVRSRRKIEQDTRRTLEVTPEQTAKLRAKLTAAREALDTHKADHAPAPARERRPQPRPAPTATSTIPTGTPTPPDIPRATDASLHPNLNRIDASTLAMYSGLAPDIDLATTPDDALRRAWEDAGWDEERIDAILLHLNDPTYRPPWLAPR